MFYFVVRHLRFLARVPLLPHFFEAALLTHTFLFHRSTLAAMEELEERATAELALSLVPHKMGGLEFRQGRREIGHLHGHGLLDVKTDPASARDLRRDSRIQPHHIFPDSGWISFPIKTLRDTPFALELLKNAQKSAAFF